MPSESAFANVAPPKLHRCIHVLAHFPPLLSIPPRASLYTMRLQVHLTTPLSPGLDAPSLLQSPTGRLTEIVTGPLAHALQSPPSNLAPPSRPSRRRAVRNCACLHGLLHTPTLQPHSRLQTIGGSNKTAGASDASSDAIVGTHTVVRAAALLVDDCSDDSDKAAVSGTTRRASRGRESSNSLTLSHVPVSEGPGALSERSEHNAGGHSLDVILKLTNCDMLLHAM